MASSSNCSALCGRSRVPGRLLCRHCWNELPEDIRERLKWAKEEGDDIERAAARRAALEFFGTE